MHTADLSAFAGCSALPLNLLKPIIGDVGINAPLTEYYRSWLVKSIIGLGGCDDVRMKKLPCVISGSHNIIARINEENFAGDGAGIGATQEERGIAYVTLFDVSAQWGCYSHLFAETGEA